MKQSLLTAALFLLAGSLASPAQQAISAADTETSKAVASHGDKPDPSKHADRSDRDGKNKKNKNGDKMKKTPAKEEQEYDPTKGMWG